MKYLRSLFVALVVLLPMFAGGQTNEITKEFIGWTTNGAAVMRSMRLTSTLTRTQLSRVPPWHLTNAAYATNPIIRRMFTNSWVYTNQVFESYLPNSLPQMIWTHFMAHTNSRDLRIWVERSHSADWPKSPPVAVWNTNSMIWGMKGVTALSPCWQGEGAPGQVPLTLLTRRHAYTRGHGMGPNGFNKLTAGHKAWFVTADNTVVEVKVLRSVVRAGVQTNGPPRDYTILLFDRDLPETIEAMAVTLPESFAKLYPQAPGAPTPIFQTEQGGDVSTGIAPLTVNTWKGGDSGSPNMIPLPGRLVFFSGRSTSGPSPAMQADMDELCRLEKLNPARYQLQWVDLEKYPPG